MPPAPPVAERRRGFTPGRIAAVAVAVAIALLWIYAFAQARVPPPDRLDDAAFATAAEPVCQAGVAAMAALPPAYEMPTAQARADVIDRSNVGLRAMVDQLRALTPTAERDRGMVQEWTTDWEVYIGDRGRYAEALRQDPNARFNVSAKSKDQITEPVDRFAKVNNMPTCVTPQDLG